MAERKFSLLKRPSEELSHLMEEYLKSEGATEIKCCRPYIPQVPISVCVRCIHLAGAKIPFMHKRPIVICYYGGKHNECGAVMK